MNNINLILCYMLSAFFSLYLISCAESTGSENIKTDAIYADMAIVSEDDGYTRVTVQLRVGGPFSNTSVELNTGDRLEVSDGTETKVMTKREQYSNRNEYVTTFHDTVGDTKYTINFIREIEDSALNSSITLPAPVNIDSPDGTVDIPRDKTLFITLSSVDVEMEFDLRISGYCTKDYYKTVTFPEYFSEYLIWAIDPEQLLKKEFETNSCQTTIKTTRYGPDGAISGAFGEGGDISARMSTSQDFTSVP